MRIEQDVRERSLWKEVRGDRRYALGVKRVEVQQIGTMFVNNGVKREAVAPARGKVFHLDASIACGGVMMGGET